MNLTTRSLFLLAILTYASCSKTNSQPSRETLPGTEVLPGSPLMDVSFFAPFKVKGRIVEEQGGDSKIFRDFEKEMMFDVFEGKKVIKQTLVYTNSGNPTGTHTTYYDPNTFQVIYWEYRNANGSTHFAFKSQGTKLSGTQNPAASTPEWQEAELGIGLFQNESRELFFRSLHQLKKGTQVKFPVIGMQAPFHGWVAYEFKKTEVLDYDGEKVEAKIWSAVGNASANYAVIDRAPYVIRREIAAGKKSKHVFQYFPL